MSEFLSKMLKKSSCVLSYNFPIFIFLEFSCDLRFFLNSFFLDFDYFVQLIIFVCFWLGFSLFKK